VNGTTTSGEVGYVYDFDVGEPGEHPFLPRIYATRAMGELLRDIKQNGETPEKVELVKLYGMRYGIETPYSSLNIRTDAVFDSDGFRTLTGKASVHASQLIHSYSGSRIAGVGLAGNARMVGGRTLVNLGGIYIESSLLPDDRIIELHNVSVEEWLNTEIGIDRFVKFASPEYFSLAEEKETRDILSLGPEVVFRGGSDGRNDNDDENVGEVIGVTRGNLLLYIRSFRAQTHGRNLSITWETSAPANSVLYYRETDDNGTGEWNTVIDSTLATGHNITLDLPFGLYEFFVRSTDADGNTAVRDNNNEYYTMYHYPLAITAVQINVGYAAIAGRTVVIRWYTNIPADGSLYFRVDNGSWLIVGRTSNTMFHETYYNISSDYYWHTVTIYFYVMAQTGDLTVIEDNNGEFFSFTVVKTPYSISSFDAGSIHILISVSMVAGLFVVPWMKTRMKKKKRSIEPENRQKRKTSQE